MTTPLFRGLTRPASFGGLPMTHVVVLAVLSVGGFIASLSILWLVASAPVGYAALRLLAAWDPRAFDVLFTVLRATPLTASQVRGQGAVYDA